MTLPGAGALDDVLAAAVARLPQFLPSQRWFGGKGQAIERVIVRDQGVLLEQPPALLLMVDVLGQGGDCATYFLPLVATEQAPAGKPAEPVIRQGGVAVYDGLVDPVACRAVLHGIATGQTVRTAHGGSFVFRPTASRPSDDRPSLAAINVAALDVRRLSAEQSNSSVIFGEDLILKAFRRTQQGQNPEVEILRFLGEQTTFQHVPRLLGWAEYQPADGPSMPVGVLQAFVPNEGDGWEYVIRTVTRSEFRGEAARLGASLGALGRTLAELHLALASRADLPDFAPEPISPDDIDAWRDRTRASLEEALCHVERGLAAERGQSGWSEALRPGTEVVRRGADALRAAIDRIGVLADGLTVKTRHHGDFHLGQTLVGPTGWTLIDFEGEPLRSLAERRAKQTPLRDVAGLLRSLDYARVTIARQRGAAEPDSALSALFADLRQSFLSTYVDTIRATDAPLLPPRDKDLVAALQALEVEKALYELGYEVGNRPDWIAIPLSALARLAR